MAENYVLSVGFILQIAWIIYFAFYLYPRKECPTSRKWIIHCLIYMFAIFSIPLFICLSFYLIFTHQGICSQLFNLFIENFLSYVPHNPMAMAFYFEVIIAIVIFVSCKYLIKIKSFTKLSLAIILPLSIYTVTCFGLLIVSTDSFRYFVGTPIERLEIACERGQTAQVVELIHSGMNVDTSFGQYRWPLRVAVSFGHMDTVTTLIALGADVNKTEEGCYPILTDAVYHKDLQIMDYLVTHGTNTANLTSAFQTAIYSSQTEIAAYLLKKGADINALLDTSYDENEVTILMYVTKLDDLKDVLPKVKFLVNHGASLKIRNKNGDTAMLYAARYSNPKVLEYLLDQGSPIEDKNNQGETALLLCRQSAGYISDHLLFQKFDLILSRGANINARDKDGNTVFDIVRYDPELTEYLKKYIENKDFKKSKYR